MLPERGLLCNDVISRFARLSHREDGRIVGFRVRLVFRPVKFGMYAEYVVSTVFSVFV